MIISLHSNGHWIMTFHKDLLNRVLDTDITKRKDSSEEEGNAFLSLISDCCEFIIVLIV